ncbi:TonB-dependent copper receptor [Ottowia thiooxydans]|uniref:TonB-dependent copper receptor n=1 Tax=Ottowia thiooxydans TaxID=219182 RepID=UPI0003FF2895|nr:TonB-dependent copper receptor [Ottowia thiooxydans]
MPASYFCPAPFLKLSCTSLTTTSFALFIALPAAAGLDPQGATTSLTEVVVTAVHDQSPTQVVADLRQPRQPIPASDAADYLKTIPGFSAIRSGGSNSDPVFRGQFGSRLPLLTNGTYLLGACGGRMDAPSSYISPQTFDQLTVIKGPQSVIWGPGASAGVVRFDRLPPSFTRPEARFSGSMLSATHGRNDQTATLEAGNTMVYLRGTANHSQSGDYYDGNGQRIPSAWNKWNADIALGFTPDTHTLIELSAGAGDGQARYAGRGMDGSQFRRNSFGLRFEKQQIRPWLSKLEATLYANQVNHVMDNYSLRPFPANGGMKMPMAGNVRRTTSGARMAATMDPTENWQLVTGVDIQRSPLEWRGGTPTSPYQERAWTPDAKLSNLGWFSEVNWQAAPRTRWVSGVRLDHSQAWRYDTPSNGHRSRSPLLSGFLRWEHQLASDNVVYAGLGHVQRFPDYWELIAPGNSALEKGNAFMALQPEKTTQLDVGARWKGDDWQLWVSGYLGVVQDYILFDYTAKSSAVRNVNAATTGFELGGQYRMGASWNAQATLAGTWANNRTDGRPLPQTPPAELRLGLNYAEGPWSAGALWRLVSAQHRVAAGQGNKVGKDFSASRGFGVVSLHAGYRLNQKLKLLLGVDNLFNKAYAEHLNLAGNAGFGFPGGTRINEPGRTVWLRAAIEL